MTLRELANSYNGRDELRLYMDAQFAIMFTILRPKI
jgi:hypothetical protein